MEGAGEKIVGDFALAGTERVCVFAACLLFARLTVSRYRCCTGGWCGRRRRSLPSRCLSAFFCPMRLCLCSLQAPVLLPLYIPLKSNSVMNQSLLIISWCRRAKFSSSPYCFNSSETIKSTHFLSFHPFHKGPLHSNRHFCNAR